MYDGADCERAVAQQHLLHEIGRPRAAGRPAAALKAPNVLLEARAALGVAEHDRGVDVSARGREREHGDEAEPRREVGEELEGRREGDIGGQ